MTVQIAIDGPSGAGKSTISKMLAKDLGFQQIDTGAMYRGITLYLLEEGINIDNEEEVNKVLDKIDLSFHNDDLYLNDRNVSKEIRSNLVTKNVSQVSAYRNVREKLVHLQRELAKKNDSILDGRDIGTNVLKNADLKIYLTASTKSRAKRRYEENISKNIESNYEDVYKDIVRRDEYDSNREISPLKKADDAICIDSTNLSQHEVVEIIKKIMELKNVL